MMLTRRVLLAILIVSTLLVGCNSNKPVSEPVKEEITKEEPNNSNPSKFALQINDNFITLKDWDNDIDWPETFGKPLIEDIEKLGPEADTFAGSYIRRLEFDGLKMELFSPKDNGNNFWIMQMVVSKAGYKTTKGIEVGSSVQAIKSSYPEVTVVEDGRTDPNNCAYVVSDEEQYNYLQMEVKEGIVQEIKLYHQVP